MLNNTGMTRLQADLVMLAGLQVPLDQLAFSNLQLACQVADGQLVFLLNLCHRLRADKQHELERQHECHYTHTCVRGQVKSCMLL